MYRGKQRPISNFVDLSLFVSFFPPLVAGPIVRAVYFLPQLVSAKKSSNVDVRGAVMLFLAGFIKKACIADGVAPIVDRYFAHPATSQQRVRGLACCSRNQDLCDFSATRHGHRGCPAAWLSITE